MASVFISYARSDEAAAERVGERLADLGFEVLRDNALPAHRPYAEVIEEWLAGADAVLVLWSAEAARSQWVRAEADHARGRACLVQASLDDSVPPLPFNQVQCASLASWDGTSAHPGWATVEASLASLAASPLPGEPSKPSCQRGRSICVLPFQNMSGDPEQEYFSDGISEDITTDLSKISALSVVARNTAFQFKGQSVDVSDVARKLGVSHVLEGSVRKAGDRVRITAQLIDGTSGDHVWADRYDRDLTDIFAIQDEISKAVVAELKLKLLPEEKKAIEDRGTSSAEAYNLYLMARNYWVTGNHGDRRREERVIRICQRAVEIDPDYARAWALLAIAQSNLRYGFGQRGEDGSAAAGRALSLDPTIAEAHCATARQLAEQAGLDAAITEISIGLRLDPNSWEVNKAAAYLRMRNKEIAEAARHYEKAVEVMETDYHGWGMLLSCYDALRDDRVVQAAKMTLEQTERVLAQDPSNGAAISFSVAGLSALGEGQRARDLMDRALLIDPDNLNMRYNFGCALATRLGDKEGAIDMLEPVFARTVSLGLYEVDPDLDSLRDDPRFIRMLADAKARIAAMAASPPNPPASAAPPRS